MFAATAVSCCLRRPQRMSQRMRLAERGVHHPRQLTRVTTATMMAVAMRMVTVRKTTTTMRMRVLMRAAPMTMTRMQTVTQPTLLRRMPTRQVLAVTVVPAAAMQPW